MAKKREPKLSQTHGSKVVSGMLQESGTGDKALRDVFQLSDGRLKMVGAKHTERVGMLIPEALNDAWQRAADDRGLKKTDIFEDAMLRWLGNHGWKLGELDGPEGGN